MIALSRILTDFTEDFYTPPIRELAEGLKIHFIFLQFLKLCNLV